jgi:capsular polysaccharide biosynthesis protein
LSAVETPRRNRIAIGPTLLRRGWIVLASMIVVGLIAYGVANLQAATYTANATLTVSPALGPANPGNAQQAAALAVSYAKSVPDDEELRGLVRSRVSSRGAITASGGRASVFRVTYTNPSRGAAIRGARVVADALSSGQQQTASVTPGTVEVVKHARSATFSGGRYRATSVLLVPSGAAPAGGISADQANKLATTYAALIPSDDNVLASAASQLHTTRADVSKNLSLVNVQNTSILQVTYKAGDPKTAANGARQVARLVAGPRPKASGVIPSSLQLVSLPNAAATKTKDTGAAIPIGVALGFLLGLVLLVAWERSDPHVRDPRDLSAQIGCPATPVDRLSADAANALVERWAALTDRVPAYVAVLPANAAAQASTEVAIKHLVQSSGGSVRYEDARSGAVSEERAFAGDGMGASTDVVLVHAGLPGGEGAGESVALGCDLTVVVVPMGMKAAEVRSLAEDLGDFGIAPVWSLLTPRRLTPPRTGTRVREGAAAG